MHLQPGRAVVVTSDSLLALFEATYTVATGMTSVITPGIILPKLPISDEGKLTARQQLGLPQAQPCILFVGNDFRKDLPAMDAGIRTFLLDRPMNRKARQARGGYQPDHFGSYAELSAVLRAIAAEDAARPPA